MRRDAGAPTPNQGAFHRALIRINREFDGGVLAVPKRMQNHRGLEVSEGQARLIFNADFTENIFGYGNERSDRLKHLYYVNRIQFVAVNTFKRRQ